MFKKIGLVGILLAALAAPVFGQTPSASITPSKEAQTCSTQEKAHTLNFGYNAIESAVGDKGLRTRLFTDVAAGKNFQLRYNGLNEVTSFDPQTYFAKHVFTAGGKKWTTKPEIVLKTDAHGLKSAQAGIKNTSIPKALGGYGWAEANVGKYAGTSAIFYGKAFGPFGVELMHSATFPYREKPQHYTEIQPYARIGEGWFGFGRAEVDNGKFGNGTYMLGLGKKF